MRSTEPRFARSGTRHPNDGDDGAQRLWDLLTHPDYVPTLGALTGNQAVQQVKAGLKAIYLSGWQVAGDANLAGQMYPDQSSRISCPRKRSAATWAARCWCPPNR